MTPNEHPTASTSLLGGIQDMDPVQWSRLVNTFGPIAYAWCHKSGVPEADCPDVVQNVFVTVARGIGAFQRVKSEGSFRSWLATITRSRVCDYFRSANRNPAARGGSSAQQFMTEIEATLDESIDAEAAKGMLVSRLLELVEGDFSPTTWRAFWLSVVEQVPASQVAQETSLSLASVYQARSRVMRRLKEEFDHLPK